MGTKNNDLLIVQGGTRYDGAAGTDTLYANWSAATSNIVWSNDPVSTQTINGVSLAGFERLLISTGSGNDSISNAYTGNATADYIDTGAGNDTLDGGAGADTLIGGTGSDLYSVDQAGDSLTELAGGGTDTVQSSLTWTLGAEFENLTLTGSAAIDGTGNALANVLIGNGASNRLTGGLGNDTLAGGAGIDTLTGGAGNDLYVVDDVGDSAVELATGGIDTVQSSVTWTLGTELEHLTLTGNAAIDGTGNAGDNRIYGNEGANTLTGLAGNDTIQGGAGDDLIRGEAASGTVTGSLVLLNQSSFAATAGVITFDNLGQSNPGYSLAVSDIGTVSINTGGWFVGQAASLLPGSATVLTLADATPTANSALALDPTANAVQVVGDTGVATSPVLSGSPQYVGTIAVRFSTPVSGVGLTGGYFDAVGSTTIVAFDALGNSLGTVKNTTTGVEFFGLAMADGSRAVAGISVYMTGADLNGFGIDNLTFGGTGSIVELQRADDQLFGEAGNDTLLGGYGNDTLDGGSGADSLVGGLGDDIYVRDASPDVVVESAGEGFDTVISSVNYTLAANLESLQLATGATNGGGNALDNELLGNAANNVLAGAGGHDTLDGGAGSDTLYGGAGGDFFLIDAAGDRVVENAGEGSDTVISSVNHTLAANVETLSLIGGATNGGGNALANVLLGNAANNLLAGAAGNDTLDGGLGADSLHGGLGDDAYLIDAAGDRVVENLGEGTDMVATTVNHTLAANVEQLVLLDGATNGGGNALANVIVGNAANNLLAGAAGDDTLNGAVGADSLYGGLGNDVYLVDSTGDRVVEGIGEGTDRVVASVNHTLAVNVENLTLADGASNGGGNALANVLIGNAANNVLSGAAGADTMIGGMGYDVYYRDHVGDVITENAGEGSDTVYTSVNYTLAANVENLVLQTGATNGGGNALANRLTGNAANNVLAGAAGVDTLVGGLGNDTLYGGADADRFVFDTALNAASNVDTVADWAAGDLLVLDNDVFTALGAAGSLSAAQFFSGAGLTGSSIATQGAGVYYDSTAGALYYDADGFGGVAGVKFAVLTGTPVLSSAAFSVQD